MGKSPPALDITAYMEKPQRAVPLLASYLSSGSLALAIGAGTSGGLGLPEWKALVERCCVETNRRQGTSLPVTVPAGADNREMCELVDQVEKSYGTLSMGRSVAFREMVRCCLYQGVTYDSCMLKKDLLIAIGALLMGSKRGSVKEVFNFNFDDVLDWYLALHGFDTQIVSALPALRREPDVTVYHPHGYVPLKVKSYPESDFLIFSQHAYEEKLCDKQEPWLALFEKTMLDRVFLFVGLSGDDQTLGQTITAVQKKVQVQRYTAFWLCGPDVKPTRLKYFKNRNIVPLRFGLVDEIPEFILSVCQKALTV